MLACVKSVALQGIDGHPLTVEVDAGAGLPAMVVVGLPDRAVQESRERIRLAVRNAGYEPPRHGVTVNLAPSDIRKEGTAYDLPIAVGFLLATGQIEASRGEEVAWLGELALD